MKKLAFLVLFIFVSYTCAFSSVIISKLIGKVMVLSGNNWVQAKIGQQLNQNDKIKTSNDGRAELVFQDGSTMWLKENTEIEISSLVPQERNISIKIGKIRFKIISLPGGAKFYARTPTAVAAIRGTEFILSVEEKTSQLFVLSGKVEFSNIISQIAKEIEEGQKSTSDETGNLSVPENFTPEDTNMINDESWQKFEDIEKTEEEKKELQEEQKVKEDIKKEINELRQEIRNAINDIKTDVTITREYTNEIREADVSTGRTLRDAFGNLVRVEQYLLRPDKKTIQFLNITKRQDYKYRGFFTYNGPKDARIDSVDVRIIFNMGMPDDIGEWPSFVASKGDDLHPEKMRLEIASQKDKIKDAMITENIYNEKDDDWTSTVKMVSNNDEWLLDTEDYSKEETGWFDEGSGIGNDGDDKLWIWMISPMVRIYKDNDGNGKFSPNIDTEKFIHTGTELFVINNDGNILSIGDFTQTKNINPFTLIKQVAAQQSIVVKENNLGKPLVPDLDDPDELSNEIKDSYRTEFNSLPNFFTGGNLDLVYTADIIVPIAQKLMNQMDKIEMSSSKSDSEL